jgi:hypothetical protein
MKVTRSVYEPPPSGKRMEYAPFSSVFLRRVMPVSVDLTSTRAPATGAPAGSVTFPMMMSVVDPTCAAAGVIAGSRRHSTIRKERSSETRMIRSGGKAIGRLMRSVACTTPERR